MLASKFPISLKFNIFSMHAHCVFLLYRLSEGENKFTYTEDLQQLTVYVKSQNHTNFKAWFQGNMENKWGEKIDFYDTLQK